MAGKRDEASFGRQRGPSLTGSRPSAAIETACGCLPCDTCAAIRASLERGPLLASRCIRGVLVGNYWEGTKIRLRAVEPKDAEAHFRFNLRDDYGMLDQIYPPGSLSRVEQWASRRSLEGLENDAYSFQIEAIGSGELVGGIATHHCDQRLGVLSYGLHVFEEHRGRGYASEAIRLVLRYYFQERRYQKANVGVFAINEPSRRLHESLGFQLEGRIRRSVLTRGEFSDMLEFGMTVEEFRDRHGAYWR